LAIALQSKIRTLLEWLEMAQICTPTFDTALAEAAIDDISDDRCTRWKYV